jgi:hypothetical protein
MSDVAIKNHAAFIWSIADLLRGDYKQSDYGKGHPSADRSTPPGLRAGAESCGAGARREAPEPRRQHPARAGGLVTSRSFPSLDDPDRLAGNLQRDRAASESAGW